jgi:pyridoxine 5-phosphate synthase
MVSPLKLGVNIDHVASLRQLRGGIEPQPVFAARACESAGADSIVAHLREDRRHINDQDICLLRKTVSVKFNLEMSINTEIVDIACRVKPDQATLVPERRQEVTTEGGLDVVRKTRKIAHAVSRLEKAGIRVSLFIDPNKKSIDAAHALNVRMLEFHTGEYANAKTLLDQKKRLTQLAHCSSYAYNKGMNVYAGHGLDYHNVIPVARIPEIEESNIGYSIVCHAVLVGLTTAVKDMLIMMQAARPGKR